MTAALRRPQVQQELHTMTSSQQSPSARRENGFVPIRRLRMQLKFLVLATVCAVLPALPASAHHSHNNYAMSDFTLLEGTVTEVHYLNPHSWVYVQVKDAKGEAKLWALEATGPGGLERNGIKKVDIAPGDSIKVRCHALRDGGNGCLLGFLTPNHGDAARGHGVEKKWD
jgi:hypothetical protein